MNTHNDSLAFARLRHFASITLLLVLTSLAAPTFAEWPKTPQDFARLPRYCAARLLESTFPKAEHDRWAKRIGPDFLHIHHYCAAQHSLHLANTTQNANDRILFLRAIVSEINYIETHTQPTFFMRAETSVQKGRALLRLNQIPDAIQSFNAALKVNPRFPAAYAGIAEAYLMLKQPAKAKLALDRGIKAVPNSKSLRQRRATLK